MATRIVIKNGAESDQTQQTRVKYWPGGRDKPANGDTVITAGQAFLAEVTEECVIEVTQEPIDAAILPGETGPKAPKSAPAGDDETGLQALLGSSTLPALIDIGGTDVQLGTIVAAALIASGLTVDEWNALSDEDRDVALNAEIETRRAAVQS